MSQQKHYQQTAEKQEGLFGRKDSTKQNNLQSDQSAAVPQYDFGRIPDQMVVMTNFGVGGVRSVKKIYTPETIINYRMMSARLKTYLYDCTPRISIGNASLIDTIGDGSTWTFSLLNDKRLKAIANKGYTETEKLYVAMKLPWSKSCGPIYEEAVPFESQRTWAERCLNAVYFGRRIDSDWDGNFAPKHGVDYFIFPLKAIEEAERRKLLEDYIKAAIGYSCKREEAKAHVASKQKEFSESFEKIMEVLDTDDQCKKEQEALEAELRKQREERVRNTPISGVIGSMNMNVSRPVCVPV